MKKSVLRWWNTAKRRKVAIGIGAWGLVVAIMAFTATSVSVREQAPAADAVPVLNAAAGAAAAVLSLDGAAFSVGALLVDDDCDITMVRGGRAMSREVVAYVDAGELTSTVSRMAEVLGETYPLVSIGTDEKPRYTAVVEGYVDLALYTETNRVVWIAETGCRPRTAGTGVIEPAFNQPAEVATLVDLLGVAEPTWRMAEIECAPIGGAEPGTARSTWATGRLPDEAEPQIASVVELVPGDARVAVSKKNLVSYLWEDRAVTVALSGRVVSVSATQICPDR